MTLTRKRRRKGANSPIDYSSFPDQTLLIYIRNLAFHVKKGDRGHVYAQYKLALDVAHDRKLDTTHVTCSIDNSTFDNA